MTSMGGRGAGTTKNIDSEKIEKPRQNLVKLFTKSNPKSKTQVNLKQILDTTIS